MGTSLAPNPTPPQRVPPSSSQGRVRKGSGRRASDSQGAHPLLSPVGWLRSHPDLGLCAALPTLTLLLDAVSPSSPPLTHLPPPPPLLSAQAHHLPRPWLSESPGKAAFFETGRCPQVSGRKNSQAEPTKTVSKGPGLARGQD